LIGGDKTGDDRWYETHVPLADRIYEEHLDELSTSYGQGTSRNKVAIHKWTAASGYSLLAVTKSTMNVIARVTDPRRSKVRQSVIGRVGERKQQTSEGEIINGEKILRLACTNVS